MTNHPSIRDNQEVRKNLQQLLDDQKTLSLATVSSKGDADIGYAPFILDEHGRFYIYVSELAVHTRNLLRHPAVSVLVIRPETEANNLFARERAIYQCKAVLIERNEPLFTLVMENFSKRFGAIVELLRNLQDFHLIQLHPENGRYIAGFGGTFVIDIFDGTLISIHS